MNFKRIKYTFARLENYFMKSAFKTHPSIYILFCFDANKKRSFKYRHGIFQMKSNMQKDLKYTRMRAIP
jgi:hypothetical protein